MKSDEHVNFHSFKSNGDVNFFITPLDGPREKGGKCEATFYPSTFNFMGWLIIFEGTYVTSEIKTRSVSLDVKLHL
jgi:hypothetical protein